ncbi:beta-alanine-activating enzyme-like [Macrobrachium nipponense]|uniref:beta-alanine-activating enzyme-like n=1 Tax=Macrobrachium nipponense TaxID=159736 RepID=UPI0030C8C4C8
MSLAKIFNDVADAYPNNVAILYFESEVVSRKFMYKELQDESFQVLKACNFQRSKNNHQDCRNVAAPLEDVCISQCIPFSSPNQSMLSNDTFEKAFSTENKASRATKSDVACKNEKNSDCIVGVMCEPGPCSVACMLGIMQKYTYFFISPDWKENEVKLYLYRVSPNILLIEECFMYKFSEISLGAKVNFEVFGSKFFCFNFSTGTSHLRSFEEGKLAYIMLTSGSTGTPKVVYVPHKCIIPNVMDFSDLFQVTSEDSIFCASPPTFDPCMIDLFVGFQAGATLVMTHNFILKMPKSLLKVLTKSKITILQATPSLVFNFGKQRMKESLLGDESHLKILALGGEMFPKLSVFREWMSDKCKTRIFNVYGVTEVSCWASVTEVFVHQEPDSTSSHDEVLVLEKRENPTFAGVIPSIPPKTKLDILQTLTPIGNPLSSTVIKVLNKLGEEVEDEEGEIYVGGSERVCWVDDGNLNSGNGNQTFCKLGSDEIQGECNFSEAAKSPNEISVDEGTEKNPLIMRNTGDRGIINRGKIFCLGRKDRQVKRQGKKISLSEIERQCESLSYVENCQVMLHNKIKIVAFVKLDSTSVCSESDIQNDLKNLMSDWKLPDYIVPIHSLPVTNHGKVDKSELMKYLCESSLKKLSSYDCQNTTEFVKEVWKRILGIRYDGDGENLIENENFIKSGGNSLSALQFNEEIESNFNVKIPRLIDAVLNDTFKEVLKIIMLSVENSNERQKIKKIKLQLNHENMRKGASTSLNDENPVDFVSVNNKNSSLSKCRWPPYKQLSIVSWRSVYYAYDKEIHNHNQIATNFLWKYNLEKCIDSSPTLIEYPCGKTLLMVGSHSYKFVCIDVQTGKSQWCLTLGNRIESSPCISSDGRRVYVGCYDYNLYCISIDTGEILWKFAAKSEIKSSPAVDCETENVIFGSHDKNVYCLTSEGNLTWKLQISVGSVFSSPCIVKQQVFVATLDGMLVGINISTGDINWRVFLQKPIFSSITAYSKGIVLGSVGCEIFGFSLTGKQLWKFKTNGPVYSSAFTSVLANGLEIIAIGSHDHYVYFFNSEGQNIASYHGESAIYATPFIFCLDVKNRVRTVICETSGKYCLIDLIFNSSQKGNISTSKFTIPTVETVLECETRGEIFSSPIVFRNNLYISSRDDHIYCFKFV